MELHNLLFELLCLVWGQFKFADVVGAVQVGIVVAQLGLDRVGAQQRQRGEGAGQAPRQDVLPELQAQVVPGGKTKHCLQRAERNSGTTQSPSHATDKRSTVPVPNSDPHLYVWGNAPMVKSVEERRT